MPVAGETPPIEPEQEGQPSVDEENGRASALFVASLRKGFQVLQAFRDAESALGLMELCQRTGLGKSAVQRFCHTLVELGYLKKDERTRRYSPAPQLLDFAFMYLHSDPLIQVASPWLVNAKEECHEAMNLARRIGTDVIYLVRLPSPSARLTNPLIGGRAPVFCTASGRAILSTLPRDEVERIVDACDRRPLTPMTITDRDAVLAKVEEGRRDGFTIANQECIVGEITTAAPILGRDRTAVAAINISAAVQNYAPEEVRAKLAPVVTRTALEISRALGLSPFA